MGRGVIEVELLDGEVVDSDQADAAFDEESGGRRIDIDIVGLKGALTMLVLKRRRLTPSSGCPASHSAVITCRAPASRTRQGPTRISSGS